MRIIFLLATALAFLLSGNNWRGDLAMNELERLQGSWNFVSLEVEGSKFSKEVFKTAKISIKGDAFTTTSMGATYSGTVKVDDTKNPKTIDMIFAEGPEKGKTSLGIYVLDGDNLKICLGLAGRERPKEFVTKPGSGHALEMLEREKQ